MFTKYCRMHACMHMLHKPKILFCKMSVVTINGKFSHENLTLYGTPIMLVLMFLGDNIICCPIISSCRWFQISQIPLRSSSGLVTLYITSYHTSSGDPTPQGQELFEGLVALYHFIAYQPAVHHMALLHLMCYLLLVTCCKTTCALACCEEGSILYVRPDNHTLCPSPCDHCQILSEYARNPTDYFGPNTSRLSLPGEHVLDTDFYINGTTSSYLTFLADQPDKATGITCTKNSSLEFTSLEILKFVFISVIVVMERPLYLQPQSLSC